MASGRYERQLVLALSDERLGRRTRRVAMRAPASGAATERELPDIIAGVAIAVAGPSPYYLSNAWGIELKTVEATTAYFDADEIDDLCWFCRAFGARPLAAAKFKRPNAGTRSPFYLVRPADCRLTPEGNYGIPEADADERAFAVVYAPTKTKPAKLDIRGDPTDE